jgi:hypothetical protein
MGINPAALASAESQAFQQGGGQAFGICVLAMCQPGFKGALDVRKGDFPSSQLALAAADLSCKAGDGTALEANFVFRNPHTQKVHWSFRRGDVRFSFVQAESQANQEIVEGISKHPHFAAAASEEHEIVGVTHVTRRAEIFANKMIYHIEVNVCEKLTCQVPDRETAGTQL